MSLAAEIGATVLPGSAHKTAPEAESERTQLHLLGFWPTVFNSRLRFGLGALFLLLVGLIIYRPLLPGNFIMDDLKLVQWDNPIVNGKLGPGSIWFRADFPLSTLALWLQWKAWASNPLGYHIVNIVLHALSAFLVWQVLIRLQVRGAWVAAVFFVVHPVCVSTVARIAEIKNTLSLPFFLLSFWAYLGYERTILYAPNQAEGKKGAGAFYYTLSLLAFVLSLLAKPSVVMLPVVLLCCAAWQRRRIQRKDLIHTFPHFFVALSFGLMSSWFQKYQALGGQPLASQSFWTKLELAGRICWFYLGKAILPLKLNVIYPNWDMGGSVMAAVAPLLLLSACFLLGWAFRKSWGRHFLFALACFVILLFPAMGFFDAQFLKNWQVSDHLQYVALIAPLTLAAAALFSAMPRRIPRWAALGIAVSLALAAFNRAYLFTSEEILLQDAVTKNPAAWAAHNDLGCLFAQRQKYHEAMNHFTASLKHNPDFPDAHVNLGQALLYLQRPDEAETHFAAALRNNPAHADAHRGFAKAMAMRDRRREAIGHLRAALCAKPDLQTHLDYALMLYQNGDRPSAISQLRKGAALNPNHPDVLNNLAWLLATSPQVELRDGMEAVRCARRACWLTHFKQARPVGTLGAAYAEAGRFTDAVQAAEKAVDLADAGGETQFAMVNRHLLGLYQKGEPFHEPAMPPPAQATFPKGQ